MKEKIFDLFNKGEFKKAIIGNSDFFWKDEFWGNHNSSAVISYFFDWYLLKGNDRPSLDKIKQFLIDEIQNDRRINEIDKGLVCLSLIRFYCSKANGSSNWILEKDFILQLLFDCISRYTNEELVELNIKRDIATIEKIVPEVYQVSEEIKKRLK